MRRGFSLLVLAALTLAPVEAVAQRLQPRIRPASAERAQARPAPAPQVPGASGPGHSLLSTILYGAGGAVIGGWAGYMASQIVWSDWQRVSRPGGPNRLHYTLTGAGIGAIAGALLGHHARPGGEPAPPLFGNRPAITSAQIEASHTRTVQELIQLLRPQWLNSRGSDLIQPAAGSSLSFQSAEADVVRVYLDGELLGGPDELAQIPTPDVLRVEYYDMTAATLRWGAGHSHGAINVIRGKGQS